MKSGAPLPPGPRTLHLDLTNGCNTDCVTCWDHSPHLAAPRDPAWKARRADLPALLDLIDDAASGGTLEHVLVSGMGEPLTHPGALPFLAALKARGLHVTLLTNLLHPAADDLTPAMVDTLLVGLHAASEPTYRAFHPTLPPGAFATVRGRLARRAAAGSRDKHVHAICAVNAAELSGMIDRARELAAERVNFKLASLSRGTEAVRLPPAERERLLREALPAAERRAAELGVKHNLPSLAAQLAAGDGATSPIETVGCHMGDRYARVAVDGTVYFCCNTETAVGRIDAATRFRDLWTGRAWAAMRDRLRARDFLPGCRRCGKFEQNAKIAAKLAAARSGGA